MSIESPKVSIIVPCYNMGDWVEETLDSIRKQTFRDFEVIVVDDGSTDEATIQLLDRIEIPQGQLLRTENQGLPAARNHGIRLAKGEYICPLDSDDLLDPRYLEVTVNELQQDQNKALAFVTTDYQFFEGRDILGIPKDYDPIALLVENCIPVTSLFRKECWEAVGGYEESLNSYEDWNLWIQFVAKGWKWKVVREPLFLYRDRAGSMLKGAERRRGELVSQLYDLNRDYYEAHADA
ncbi:MAG: glycosyltransferase family A protein, partial [Verrucomicrobiota bacterium]